jgi:hypothetical protein
MADPPLSGLSEAERPLAFERIEILRPALKESTPLARAARARGIAPRTDRRWAGLDRCDGLAGLAAPDRAKRPE